MGIISKLSTVIKSNINDLISRAENPEKMLNQIILDMRDQLAKAKREVAAAIADERKLKSQLEDEAKQARDWEHRAMLAVREGRDDLAKQALIRQQEHGERVQVLQQTWQAQAGETEKLKGSLRQLNDKIEEAKRKRNLLIAKQKRAQAQRRIHDTHVRAVRHVGLRGLQPDGGQDRGGGAQEHRAGRGHRGACRRLAREGVRAPRSGPGRRRRGGEAGRAQAGDGPAPRVVVQRRGGQAAHPG